MISGSIAVWCLDNDDLLDIIPKHGKVSSQGTGARNQGQQAGYYADYKVTKKYILPTF